jgi:transcription-repair coupling factor (superfamily II helicase)
MHGILKPLEASAEFVSLAAGLKEKQKQMVFGLSGPQRAYLLAGLVEQAPNRSFLVLTAGEREAADLGDAIACFSPGSAILQFPVMHLRPAAGRGSPQKERPPQIHSAKPYPC